MDQNKIRHDPRHVGVPSDASKMISEPMVRLVHTMHLSCTDANATSKQKEERFHMTHITKELHRVHAKMISGPMLRSTQTVHLSCVKISTIKTDRNELPLESRHLVEPSVASKLISEPMVRPAQTMHPSCTDANTVSKRKEVRFHMTHIT